MPYNEEEDAIIRNGTPGQWLGYRLKGWTVKGRQICGWHVVLVAVTLAFVAGLAL